MKIFNTMTKKKEEFVPLEEGKVKMYVCGPTVYNFIHIGNARPMIVFDTVRRYFEYKGYDVNYVSNFTDVDDKIIKKAIEEGVSAEEISTRYIAECKKDMESISRAIGVAAMLGTGITLVLAVVLFLWPVQIMDLLSNKHELSVLGAPYLKLIGFSYVFNMLSSIYVSAMRSAENAGFGMKLFGVSTLLNTGMNYILIFGKCGFPALGIQGAAIATLLSRVAEFLICLVCAMRSRILPLDLAAFFRPGWEMLRRFVKYSTPVILNETAWGLGVGCLIANLFSPYGVLDIVVGSLATLIAALITSRCRNVWLAALPPVACNMVLVGAVLAYEQAGTSAAFWPAYGLNAVTVGAGEAIACLVLGVLLVKQLPRIPYFRDRLQSR